MKITSIHIVIVLLILSCNAQDNRYLNYNSSLNELINIEKIDISKISVLIDKSDYKLIILFDSKIIKEYPVVFGKNTTDDKLMQGDQCTPEGSFKMISKYPHKEWSKFIWINYPNDDSWKKHQLAKKEGKIPKDSKIGGEIGIHGVPKNMDKLIDLKINWTLGCISMKNRDINEIYPYFKEDTTIKIKK